MYTELINSSCLLLVLVGGFSVLFSCQHKGDSQMSLEGRYIIVSAERNGRSTTTLEDGFFELLGDSIIKTNIFGDETNAPVQIDGHHILQSGPMPVDYTVDFGEDDTMYWQAHILSNDFIFTLIRDTAQINPDTIGTTQ